MKSSKFYSWKFIFATLATVKGLHHAEEIIEGNHGREISERGLNQFCDYMEFTRNDLLMYPCNMTEKISKLYLIFLSFEYKISAEIYFKECLMIQHTV